MPDTLEPKAISYADIFRAVTEQTDRESPICPICYLVLKSIGRYLDTVVHWSAIDPASRRDVREARGYCSNHASQLIGIRGGTLGTAIIHCDVIETAIEEVEKVTRPALPAHLAKRAGQVIRRLGGLEPDNPGAIVVEALRARQECPACLHQQSAEKVYVDALLRNLSDGQMADALRASSGLCLPHFRLASSRVRDERTLALLTDIEMVCLRRLAGELQEFIRKYDWQHRNERMGMEGDAWLRSIDLVSGARGTH